MTALFFGFGEIPRRAETITGTAETGHEFENLGFGPRRLDGRAATAGATSDVKWDLSAARAQAADFLYLGGLSLLARSYDDVRIRLAGSNDNSAFTDLVDVNPVDPAALIGPRREDYITTFATSSSYRYWRLRASRTGGGDIAAEYQKVFTGLKFDFGRNPLWSIPYRRKVDLRGNRDPRYAITLNYQGITNAKLQEFDEKILQFADVSPVVVFTTDIHHLLDGKRALLVWVTAKPKCVSHNNNDLELSLIEDI